MVMDNSKKVKHQLTVRTANATVHISKYWMADKAGGVGYHVIIRESDGSRAETLLRPEQKKKKKAKDT